MRSLALALLLALSASANAAPPPEMQAVNTRVFDKAWSLVGRRYWDRDLRGLDWAAERERFRPAAREAADKRALYAAINALLGRLDDSHVYAISPAPTDFAHAQGTTERGFGFDAYPAGGRWLVHRVQPGGPAARAGVQLGWRVVSIDGRPYGIDDRFGAQDEARLVLEDELGDRHDLALTAAALPPEPSRRSRRLAGGVLLLAFDQFAAGDDRWLRDEIAAPDVRAVILDLRENEGGEAGVLDRIAGLFVTERRVVLTLKARRERSERSSGRAVWLGPLAVLVGPRTASAAEALAAFLDEAGRADTVGERTAGALTAGAEHRLPDGGRLIVAEHDIRTPGGVRLEAVGLAPRHPVKPTLAELRAGSDPVLAKALALVSGR